MKTQIVLSGVGGQGLISTGEIIGEAASIHEMYTQPWRRPMALKPGAPLPSPM